MRCGLWAGFQGNSLKPMPGRQPLGPLRPWSIERARAWSREVMWEEGRAKRSIHLHFQLLASVPGWAGLLPWLPAALGGVSVSAGASSSDMCGSCSPVGLSCKFWSHLVSFLDSLNPLGNLEIPWHLQTNLERICLFMIFFFLASVVCH